MEWRGEVKPMVYKKLDHPEIIAEGCYKDHRYAVVNLGTHPCGYVECKTEVEDGCYDKLFEGLPVHGGATFYGSSNWDMSSCMYVGWDYTHYGDWSGIFTDEFNQECGMKKHNTEEILSECFQAIDYLALAENGLLTNADGSQSIN